MLSAHRYFDVPTSAEKTRTRRSGELIARTIPIGRDATIDVCFNAVEILIQNKIDDAGDRV